MNAEYTGLEKALARVLVLKTRIDDRRRQLISVYAFNPSSGDDLADIVSAGLPDFGRIRAQLKEEFGAAYDLFYGEEQ